MLRAWCSHECKYKTESSPLAAQRENSDYEVKDSNSCLAAFRLDLCQTLASKPLLIYSTLILEATIWRALHMKSHSGQKWLVNEAMSKAEKRKVEHVNTY